MEIVRNRHMRKIILQVAVSLDGFIEGPAGEFDWCFTDQDYGMTEFLAQIDALFMGRKTYELTQSMGGEGGGVGFPQLKEYVFSNTLKSARDATVIIKGDLSVDVMKIKNSPGKNIWLFGGADLTTSLMRLGLVDEIWLAVHPILLGGGKTLFKDIIPRTRLSLIDTKAYSTGLVSMRYVVIK